MQSDFIIYFSGARQRTINRLAALLLPVVFFSCKKQNEPPGTASLSMVNAVVGSGPLVTNFGGIQPTTYYSASRLYYNTFTANPLGGIVNNQFGSYSGVQTIALYQYPDTSDKSTPLFNLSVDLPKGSIKTLFLTGTVDAPDMLLSNDTLPFYPASDSAMGIRFVNLSPGSGAIIVNLAGAANGSEQGGLSYKSITGFRNYPVNSTLADYVFEFRDEATGELITTFTTTGINSPGTSSPNLWVYHSFTLALLGKPGGTDADAPKVLLIKHS